MFALEGWRMKKASCGTLMLFAAIGLVACGGDGDDGASSTVNAPSNLMVSVVDGGGHLTWKDNSTNESGFMIERKSGSGSWETVGDVPFDTTQFHDPDLAAGTYMYRVMAMPKSGEHDPDDGAYSKEAMLVVSESDAASGGAAGSEAPDGGAHMQHH